MIGRHDQKDLCFSFVLFFRGRAEEIRKWKLSHSERQRKYREKQRPGEIRDDGIKWSKMKELASNRREI